MSLGDIRIKMFYGCPENVNIAHSTQFITITLLKYSFSVPPGNKKNQAYPMCHKFRRALHSDVLGTSPGRQF